MHCFCLNELVTKGTTSYKFSDGGQYCYEWFGYYTLTESLIWIVPILISVINMVSSQILRRSSHFLKAHSVSEQFYSASINVALMSFMNYGVMVLLVNFKIQAELPLPILQGYYPEFSVEWYRLVGAAMCVQMLMMIVNGHCVNLLYWLLYFSFRCWDRGCTCNSKKTKQLTQEEYEAKNMSPLQCIEYGYANQLVVVLLVMMYGPGMPIMYFIAFIYFIFTYISEKALVFYHYRKPAYFNE